MGESCITEDRFDIVSGPDITRCEQIVNFLHNGCSPEGAKFHIRADVANEPDRIAKPPFAAYSPRTCLELRIYHADGEYAVDKSGAISAANYRFEADVKKTVTVAHTMIRAWTKVRGVYCSSTGRGYLELL